jgi:hypothetical protein
VSLAAAVTDPSRKDVVVAVLSASAALGGFVLVFLGVLISAYQSYAADATKSVKEARRRAVWPALAVFPLSVTGIALSLIWLAAPGGTCLYYAVVVVFAAELVAIVAVAISTTVRMLN